MHAPSKAAHAAGLPNSRHQTARAPPHPSPPQGFRASDWPNLRPRNDAGGYRTHSSACRGRADSTLGGDIWPLAGWGRLPGGDRTCPATSACKGDQGPGPHPAALHRCNTAGAESHKQRPEGPTHGPRDRARTVEGWVTFALLAPQGRACMPPGSETCQNSRQAGMCRAKG